MKIGNRAIDLQSITSAIYEPEGKVLVDMDLNQKVHERRLSELCISFGCDDIQNFYDQEADLLWQVICDLSHDITPPPSPASVEEPAA